MIRDPRKLADSVFDLLVIGGGIHGACTVREAARRGLSVALVERGDFGAATSHNSLKIVHGGLRYLQHADFRRTRESVRARSNWLREAPHLVRPLGFLMPLQGWLARGPAALWAALRTHELIGWDRNRDVPPDRQLPRGQLLGPQAVRRLMPGLAGRKLSGGAIWYDGQMLDADRLLLACVEDAVSSGAIVCNYVEARQLDVATGRVRGAVVMDRISGDELTIRAKRIVNAAGPWADSVARSAITGKATAPTTHTRNMNVVIPEVTDDIAIGINSQRRSDSLLDKSTRLFFVTPWRGMSVAGTTHEPYDGAPEDYSFDDAEIDSFLGELNAAYPLNLGPDDVTYCYGGLTPAEDGLRHGQARRSRRGTLIDHGSCDGVTGLFTLVGVKYTTAQIVAAEAVDAVAASLGRSANRPDPGSLPGGAGYTSERALLLDLAATDTLAESVERESFAVGLGTQIGRALEIGSWNEADGPDALFRCRARFAVRAEMAVRLEDVLLRRTDRLVRGRLSETDLEWASGFMAEELAWSPARRTQEVEAARRAITRHRGRLAAVGPAPMSSARPAGPD